MNRLSKEKRNQLILVAIITLAVICGLWFSLIRSLQQDLHLLALKKADDQNKLSQINDTIKNAKRAEVELQNVSNNLVFAERDMPVGDLYLSMVNTIRKFNQPAYKVDISQFNPSGADVPVNIIPRFPYRQVTVAISGLGHYHNIGRFISDFENRYPTSRILNLDLSPSSTASAEDKERLSFQMDVVSLVPVGGARTVSNP